MSRKLSICSVLLALIILGALPGESPAVAPPDLIGTWKGTASKVTPEGFSNETITLTVVQQWDKYFKGTVSVAGFTIDFVSIINNIDPVTYNANFSIAAYKLDASKLLSLWCSGSYINNPTQITLTNIGPDDGNIILDNTLYGTNTTLIRQ